MACHVKNLMEFFKNVSWISAGNWLAGFVHALIQDSYGSTCDARLSRCMLLLTRTCTAVPLAVVIEEELLIRNNGMTRC